MPGLAEIRKLTELLQAHGHFGSADYVIFPLHSTVSSEGQGQVFDLPPRGVRKIVICESRRRFMLIKATNIAETGVTIPDVTCVIDTGKHREMRYVTLNPFRSDTPDMMKGVRFRALWRHISRKTMPNKDVVERVEFKRVWPSTCSPKLDTINRQVLYISRC
jgi:ATP-dependent RNA helicase DHX29